MTRQMLRLGRLAGLNRRALLAAGVVCGIGVVGVGYAVGAIPGAGGVIQGCYDSGGNLKVVSALPCPKGYTPVSWNQQGPAGATGATGPQGSTGATGATGTTGQAGTPGTSHAYIAEHWHVVESHTFQEIVALADLPAGKYIFTTDLVDSVYMTAESLNYQRLWCTVKANGAKVNLSRFESGGDVLVGGEDSLHAEEEHFSETVALDLPAGSDFRVACRLYGNDDDGDGASLGIGRITAFQVSAIN